MKPKACKEVVKTGKLAEVKAIIENILYKVKSRD